MKRETVAVAALAAGTGIGLLARSEYERKHMVTRECTVRLPDRARGLDGLTAVFISDLHDNELGEDNADLLQAVRKAKPDLVLIGGDMPTVKPWKEKDFSALARLFNRLAADYPIFYGLGNHEQRMKDEDYSGWWEEYSSLLEGMGICILDNTSVQIRRKDSVLRITGLSLDGDYYNKLKIKEADRAMVEKLVGPRTDMDYELLLVHNPIYMDAYSSWGADLVLSGHLHGGTIRIPVLGGVMTPQLQFFSPYTKGDLTQGSTRMLVSAGLGTHSIDIRLNNRPELVVIRFKA